MSSFPLKCQFCKAMASVSHCVFFLHTPAGGTSAPVHVDHQAVNSSSWFPWQQVFATSPYATKTGSFLSCFQAETNLDSQAQNTLWNGATKRQKRKKEGRFSQWTDGWRCHEMDHQYLPKYRLQTSILLSEHVDGNSKHQMQEQPAWLFVCWACLWISCCIPDWTCPWLNVVHLKVSACIL